MKLMTFGLLTVLLVQTTFAATRYVWPGGSDSAPYTNWSSAAHSIQAAVSAAAPGDLVLVTNGAYVLDGQVQITKAITVASVNGAAGTIVDAGLPARSNRCFQLNAVNSVLDGFTLINGYVSGASGWPAMCGGGVFCISNTLVRNCIVSNCAADIGGGAYGHYGGTVSNCLLTRNAAMQVWARGGGIELRSGGLGIDCAFVNNIASGTAGGASCEMGGTLQRCTVRGNTSLSRGGGIDLFIGGLAENCVIGDNLAAEEGGGISLYLTNNVVRGCLVTRNSQTNAAYNGGGIYAWYGGAIQNCTVSRNLSAGSGAGIYCGISSVVYNTIAYLNTPDNLKASGVGLEIAACCTYPAVSNLYDRGLNITNAPLFAGLLTDFHLLTNSPCINAGTNLPWMAGAVDLDGNPRIIGSQVDMGCYEVVPEPGCALLLLVGLVGLVRHVRRGGK